MFFNTIDEYNHDNEGGGNNPNWVFDSNKWTVCVLPSNQNN